MKKLVLFMFVENQMALFKWEEVLPTIEEAQRLRNEMVEIP